jgi:hypothetical protein
VEAVHAALPAGSAQGIEFQLMDLLAEVLEFK